MSTGSSECPPLQSSSLPYPPDLKDMSQAALFLDFDGTLVEIAPAPDAISVAPGLSGVLHTLAEMLDGRLAVVSGRSIGDISTYLDVEGIALAGSHGGELRQPGSAAIETMAEPLPPEAQAEMQRFASGREGLLLETKPFSMALHYRQLPSAEGDVLALAHSLAETLHLRIKRGKMVVEMLTPGYDKGSVVEKIMETPAFRGSRPIFVGDDITDEDAFTKVLELDGGGVLVGPERETAARWRLPGVADVHAWLKAALA